MQTINKQAANVRQHIIELTGRLSHIKATAPSAWLRLSKPPAFLKRSFDDYFQSKEEFTEALLEHYFTHHLIQVEEQLRGSEPARERLLRYFAFWKVTQRADLPESNCLVVRRGAEICDQYDNMRSVLANGTREIILRITASSIRARMMAPCRTVWKLRHLLKSFISSGWAHP